MGAAVLLTGLILANTPAGAFPPGAPQPPRAMRPGTMPHSANPLDLTPAQQEKVRALGMKMQPEVQKALQSSKSPEEAQRKLAPFQKKMEAAVMKILTPAQQVKYRAMKANAVAHGKAAMARPKAAPKP